MQVERRLTRPEGLASVAGIAACSSRRTWTTLRHDGVPSVNEAIRYADPATAERELADLAARIDRARAALEDATAALR